MKKKEPRTRAEWIQTVQDLIVKSMSAKTVMVKTKDGQGKHSLMKDFKWPQRLADEIVKEFPEDGNGDPNMGIAAEMAYVLLTWYVRIQHAKCNDPRRPLKVRREAYLTWIAFQRAIISTMVDERDDSVFKQPWNDPWLPNARGGKFV